MVLLNVPPNGNGGLLNVPHQSMSTATLSFDLKCSQWFTFRIEANVMWHLILKSCFFCLWFWNTFVPFHIAYVLLLYHFRITCVSLSYHFCIAFVSLSYHSCITFVSLNFASLLYHFHITFVSLLYHVCIPFVSLLYRFCITFVSLLYHICIPCGSLLCRWWCHCLCYFVPLLYFFLWPDSICVDFGKNYEFLKPWNNEKIPSFLWKSSVFNRIF